MGKRKFIDVKSKPNSTISSDGSNNTIDNSITIRDNNIYNYNIIQYILNDSESRTKDGFRNLLWSIFKNTEEDNHIFSGFINNINYRDKQIYLVNVFWNKRVYATNHVVIFPDDISKFDIGDFIVFKGIIDKYTRSKKKNSSKDLGIENIEIIKKVKFPKLLNIEEHEQIKIDFNNLKELNNDTLINVFNTQLAYIQIHNKEYVDLCPDVYKSILLNIFYENSKEQDMIHTRLNILDGNTDILQLTEWMMYIRYLVCEVNMVSPYMIYNMLLLTLNENRITISNDFEYFIELAKRNKFMSTFKIGKINESFNYYLNKYIDEIFE